MTSVWLVLDCCCEAKTDNNWSLEYLGGFVELSTLVEPTGIAEMTVGSAIVEWMDSVEACIWLEV